MSDDLHDADWYESYFGPDYLKIDIQPYTDIEVDFIISALKLDSGGKLLDVACGYGRHLLPLAHNGVDVTGCDLSEFMLGEAQKRIKKNPMAEENFSGGGLVRCDVRSLPFDGVFDAACYMFNSFGYFDGDDDNFNILKSIGQALKPGGLFLLDLVNRDFLLRPMEQKDWFENDDALILEEKWYDPIRNRSEIDVQVIDKAGKRMYHHSIRLFTFSEIEMLLEAAGFTVLAVFGGFNGENFDLDHNRMLILAQSLV